MKSSRWYVIFKSSLRHFATAGSICLLITGLIATCVAIPPFILIPVVVGVGLAIGCYGGYQANKHEKQKEQITQQYLQEQKHQSKNINEIKQAIALTQEAIHNIHHHPALHTEIRDIPELKGKNDPHYSLKNMPRSHSEPEIYHSHHTPTFFDEMSHHHHVDENSSVPKKESFHSEQNIR